MALSALRELNELILDAKSEAGWDELVARKYRAWIHHTALDALALWFVAQTKLDWRVAYPRDPVLIEQLEVVVLPALSMANVRELLKAVLPLSAIVSIRGHSRSWFNIWSTALVLQAPV